LSKGEKVILCSGILEMGNIGNGVSVRGVYNSVNNEVKIVIFLIEFKLIESAMVILSLARYGKSFEIWREAKSIYFLRCRGFIRNNNISDNNINIFMKFFFK
jgi:hypothetical protein